MCYLLGETYLNPRIEARPVCGLEVRFGLEGDLVDTFAQDGELAGGFRGGLEQVHAVPIFVCRPARAGSNVRSFQDRVLSIRKKTWMFPDKDSEWERREGGEGG